jgi:hypothetical protein
MKAIATLLFICLSFAVFAQDRQMLQDRLQSSIGNIEAFENSLPSPFDSCTQYNNYTICYENEGCWFSEKETVFWLSFDEILDIIKRKEDE